MKPEDPEERAETQISTTPHKQEAELRIKQQALEVWVCKASTNIYIIKTYIISELLIKSGMKNVFYT